MSLLVKMVGKLVIRMVVTTYPCIKYKKTTIETQTKISWIHFHLERKREMYMYMCVPGYILYKFYFYSFP